MHKRTVGLLSLGVAILSLLVAAVPTGAAVPAGTVVAEQRVPRTVVLDGKRLVHAKQRLNQGDPVRRRALADLVRQADNWLGQGPWSVTDKAQTPPSGDKHDYLSQAPYWWPSQPKTPDNPLGCPYVSKDGQRNPEADQIPDHAERAYVFASTYTLSLAWYYTGEAAYARHAADILRTWFVTPETRMNPRLINAQFVPCGDDGRAAGLIEFSLGFTSLLDAAAILDTGAPGWTPADHDGFRSWSTQFLDWLTTSDFGKAESAAVNNHGTFADMQVAAIALAVGRPQLARQTVAQARTTRIDQGISPDGSQPQEIRRTRSYHYSAFNLLALTRLADVGRHVGINLWKYQGPDGQSVFKAVDFLLPAATGTAPWPYPESNFEIWKADDVIHAAADAGDRNAQAALPRLTPPPGGDLWTLRPAAELLSSELF
ncbi:alginate lyase family protein [Streptomyces flaveus]|uniref:alginate lyase family protein n=1 Tax=Streptomyces flaveus TaxID=66370 RepID=UPI0033215825